MPVRRLAAALAAVAAATPATPAAAWQADIEDGLCTLRHEDPHVAVRLTYNPAITEYAIHLTRRGGTWPEGGVFAMRFDGADPIFITTDRQVITAGGATLSVTDSGFSNVLDGLQNNRIAHAQAGAVDVAIPLRGAASEVAAFRRCARADFA